MMNRIVRLRSRFCNGFVLDNWFPVQLRLGVAWRQDSNEQIVTPGDFGRIISTSNDPRLVWVAIKLRFRF